MHHKRETKGCAAWRYVGLRAQSNDVDRSREEFPIGQQGHYVTCSDSAQ